MKDNLKKFLNGEIAFKVKKDDVGEFLKECDNYGIYWESGEKASLWNPISECSQYSRCQHMYFEINLTKRKLNYSEDPLFLVSREISEYNKNGTNTPTKLIVNLEEVYGDNKWWYSCIDYLLLSGREKLNRKESYTGNVHDNDIFKITRDAIYHSRREMAKKGDIKTPDKSIDEVYDSLTDEQKELVHYLVGEILNERNKGE